MVLFIDCELKRSTVEKLIYRHELVGTQEKSFTDQVLFLVDLDSVDEQFDSIFIKN